MVMHIPRNAVDRRRDHCTAELVDIVLLTRAAFGLNSALRYVLLAQLPAKQFYRILARPDRLLRRGLSNSLAVEGRRFVRKH